MSDFEERAQYYELLCGEHEVRIATLVAENRNLCASQGGPHASAEIEALEAERDNALKRGDILIDDITERDMKYALLVTERDELRQMVEDAETDRDDFQPGARHLVLVLAHYASYPGPDPNDKWTAVGSWWIKMDEIIDAAREASQ